MDGVVAGCLAAASHHERVSVVFTVVRPIHGPYARRGVGATGPGLGEMRMKVGFVVLYVNDTEACRAFWVDQVGMVEKKRSEAGPFVIPQVGFADQDFTFQLVPLEMMKENPNGLNLGAPSICFQVDDLHAMRARLVEHGVQASEVGEFQGMQNFAFSDPEGRWFAVTR